MNICYQCQQALAQSPKFCPECGAAFTGAAASATHQRVRTEVAALVILVVMVMVVAAVLKGIGCIMVAFVHGLAGRRA